MTSMARAPHVVRQRGLTDVFRGAVHVQELCVPSDRHGQILTPMTVYAVKKRRARRPPQHSTSTEKVQGRRPI